MCARSSSWRPERGAPKAAATLLHRLFVNCRGEAAASREGVTEFRHSSEAASVKCHVRSKTDPPPCFARLGLRMDHGVRSRGIREPFVTTIAPPKRGRLARYSSFQFR
jgi:hypothetical protein